jgi:hypothetical protein
MRCNEVIETRTKVNVVIDRCIPTAMIIITAIQTTTTAMLKTIALWVIVTISAVLMTTAAAILLILGRQRTWTKGRITWGKWILLMTTARHTSSCIPEAMRECMITRSTTDLITSTHVAKRVVSKTLSYRGIQKITMKFLDVLFIVASWTLESKVQTNIVSYSYFHNILC